MTRPAPTPVTPFPHAELRLDVARRRYFEHGELPARDTVPPLILASWQRCLAAGADPLRVPETPTASRRRARAVRQANTALLNAAQPDLDRLQQMLGATPVAAVLTDAAGVVAHATTPTRTEVRLLPRLIGVGVDLSETQVGTGTPGLLSTTGLACAVRGAEHFYQSARLMHCAAAPVRDASGRLAGGLSLFSEHGPFAFDAAAIVAAYAASIESRLLRAHPGDVLLVQVAAGPSMLDTPHEGLLGVAGDGRVAWRNGAAAALCGEHATPGLPSPLELRTLLSLVGSAAPRLLNLPNGLGVWVCASFPEHAGAPLPAAAPAMPPPADDGTLEAADARLIDAALADHGGNVSRAARALGISRGRVYRHLRRRHG
ncbi:helix-turn-helix domain-containing protein [Verticiella sediminum]|nr:helix-turn-helix domain-containing protein [Verticiella sediminum]